jgi:hypothetical protein
MLCIRSLRVRDNTAFATLSKAWTAARLIHPYGLGRHLPAA